MACVDVDLNGTSAFAPGVKNSHASDMLRWGVNLRRNFLQERHSSGEHPCLAGYSGMQLWTTILGQGLEPKELTVLQVSLRGLIIFIAAIVMVRVADKRFLSKMTALDAILGFFLASMLSRAVNGSANLLPTIASGFALVLVHRLFCWLGMKSDTFGGLVKGHEDLLIKDGKLIEQAMRANHLSRKDLLEELRQQGQVTSPSEVREAYIERSGKISVIPAKD
jgi:hypothetical protein